MNYQIGKNYVFFKKKDGMVDQTNTWCEQSIFCFKKRIAYDS